MFFGLAASAALAAISACAAGHLVSVANSVSDDLYHGVANRTASPARRLLIARLAMLLFCILVFFITQSKAADPLQWALAAFSLSAGAFFAVLTLASGGGD